MRHPDPFQHTEAALPLSVATHTLNWDVFAHGHLQVQPDALVLEYTCTHTRLPCAESWERSCVRVRHQKGLDISFSLQLQH